MCWRHRTRWDSGDLIWEWWNCPSAGRRHAGRGLLHILDLDPVGAQVRVALVTAPPVVRCRDSQYRPCMGAALGVVASPGPQVPNPRISPTPVYTGQFPVKTSSSSSAETQSTRRGTWRPHDEVPRFAECSGWGGQAAFQASGGRPCSRGHPRKATAQFVVQTGKTQ